MGTESIDASFLSIFALISFFIFLLISKYSHKIKSGALLDKDFSKPQAFHDTPVTRSGGIAAIVSLGIFFYIYYLLYEDVLYNYVIDLGIDDLLIKDDNYEIHCEKNEIYNVKKKLEFKIKNFISTKIEWIPINLVIPIEDEKQNLFDFINSIEDNEDVQNVYTNLKFTD